MGSGVIGARGADEADAAGLGAAEPDAIGAAEPDAMGAADAEVEAPGAAGPLVESASQAAIPTTTARRSARTKRSYNAAARFVIRRASATASYALTCT